MHIDKPMKRNVDLMNLFWTTAGIFPGEGEISPFDFKDRVEAAAKAGFTGIGIWHTDLEHIHCILDMGYTGPWAVEVMSRELAKLPLDEQSTKAYKTTIAAFDHL